MTTRPIALITGASRGLGRNTALNLARKGVDIVLTYRSRADEAKAAVAEIEAAGGRAAALELDTGAVASFPAFVETLKKT
ncbi:MAG: SDR family NAD(P)-dependent oxidoreductase, partial [Mesorhizobium sp.]